VEWDEDGLDDEPGSPLLPPDDRLWRHPSEVAETSPTMVRGVAVVGAGSTSVAPRVVTVVALTSAISVLLTLGVVAVVRPFGVDEGGARDAPGGGVAVTPTGSLSTVGDVAALTAQVRPAIAHVRAVGAAEGGGDAMGSGVLFHADGLMLTAHHIVEGATSLWVLLDDGRRVGARLVGGDPETDIAVLDLDGDAFPVAVLASAADLEHVVGEPAITIGAPGGDTAAGPLVRTTVVSAVGQEAGVEGHKLMDMIRTDAAMDAGCAGGAVVDRRGRVIGIASSNVDVVDGAPVGYATPIAVAAAVAEELVATGRVVRGWLGIEGASRDGALVHRVKPDSPAAAAGLTTGDVITAIDGVKVASMSALVARLRTLKPGDGVRLSVVREAATIEMPATLAEKPSG
jgi:S1-C subfamily serine protease